MLDDSAPAKPVPCVGVVCLKGDSVLLIRRGNPPRQGEWSIPGGRIERGETARAAALRELAEETGVTATLGPLVDVIDAIMESRHYVLFDFAARWTGGDVVAGDDASDARFVPLSGLADYHLWPETARVIHLAAMAY